MGDAGKVFSDIRRERHRYPGSRARVWEHEPVIYVDPVLNEDLPEFQSVDRIGCGASSTRLIM